MKKKTIAVIFGGKSSEYSVSLQSAHAVISHIPKQKYDVYMIGITKEGDWYHYTGNLDFILRDEWWKQDMNKVTLCLDSNKHLLIEMKDNVCHYQYIDAVFPVLHGKNGEDGTLQGAIQLSGIPLIGCDVLSSSLCMDKKRAHQLVESSGISVPRSCHIYSVQQIDKCKDLKYPLFVKPVKAGSSYGITQVFEESQLESAVEYAFEFDDEVVIEETIEGFEVGCAVMGIHDLKVGRVDEIELSSGFFTFEEKYTLKTSQIHMPARIDQETEKRIQETAKTIYKVLGCQVFARVDMFLTPQGDIVFNEVNTIPGFTSHSRFPNMLKGIGYTFENIIDTLIEMRLNHEDNYFK